MLARKAAVSRLKTTVRVRVPVFIISTVKTCHSSMD